MKCLLFGLLFLAGAACAAGAGHPLDVRPGMWESTMTVETSGMPPIPPEVLARMTPQQKAMIEERMKGNKITVNGKRCIKQEDLDKGLDWSDPKRVSCQRTLTTSTSTVQEMRLECDRNGMKTSGTVRVEALDPEHVKVTAHMTVADGAHTMTSNMSGKDK